MASKITALLLIIAISLLQLSVLAQKKTAAALPRNNTETANSTTIHQEVDFNVSPGRLYETLLDSKQFSEFASLLGEFSANSARIDPSVGGAFSLFDGHITGRNIELVPNQRIVQAWRAANWPAGVYSVVKFELEKQGSGTHLVLDHTGFAGGLHDGLASGWQSHYWDPLTQHFK